MLLSRRTTTVTKPIAAISPERTEFMQGELGKWDADVVAMSEDERVIYLEMIFEEAGLIKEFNIPRARLRTFLLTIRSLYHEADILPHLSFS